MPAAYVSFTAGVNAQSVNALLAQTQQCVQQGASEINLLISSPGGEVSWGMTAYNMLKGLPVPLITHNVGNVESIGTVVFLAGRTRLACTHATFMFHGVAANPMPGVPLQQPVLTAILASVRADNTRVGAIYVGETKLKAKEVQELLLAGEVKDATYAKTHGIISEIREVTIPQGVQIIRIV